MLKTRRNKIQLSIKWPSNKQVHGISCVYRSVYTHTPKCNKHQALPASLYNGVLATVGNFSSGLRTGGGTLEQATVYILLNKNHVHLHGSGPIPTFLCDVVRSFMNTTRIRVGAY